MDLKIKYRKTLLLFKTLIILLGIIILLNNNHYGKTILPYMFMCLSILQIINGLNFYKKNLKLYGVMSILCGIFISCISIKILMF